ncbi:MAG TPA: tryptophan--tRNA ligase [Fimbriimonadales bacterium]|nr:tryptophan--tRNA ligase [Fimbriimonadales bacterium]
MAKQRLLSGMQPTQPKLHLGNLEGALRNWVRLQNDYELFCCIVDWHALTTMLERSRELRANTIGIATDYLAAGIDPEKSVVFVQSQVKEHAEFYLILSMVTPLGWLERVPTFKEKRESLEGTAEASHGLLGYPVLQAADILLYKPYGVPVGKDQLPHLELTREIARRFNHLFGPVFPEVQNILSNVPILLGTDGRKMSKSYDNAIYIADDEETTVKKIMSAFTDPLKIRKNDKGHPEGCSVFHLHGVYNIPNVAVVEKECREGERGCVQCKKECISAVNASLREIREKRKELEKNPDYVIRVLNEGAERARQVASKTMQEVREVMGLP